MVVRRRTTCRVVVASPKSAQVVSYEKALLMAGINTTTRVMAASDVMQVRPVATNTTARVGMVNAASQYRCSCRAWPWRSRTAGPGRPWPRW